MKLNNYIKLLVATIIISLAFAAGAAWIFSDLPGNGRDDNVLFMRSTLSYPLKAEVVNISTKFKMGIIDDPNMINFGRISKGGQVRKSLKLSNPSSHWSVVKFYCFGNISDSIHTGYWNGRWKDEKKVLIPPHSSRSIEVGFVGSHVGNYTGMLEIVSLVPRAPIDSIIRWV